MFFRAPTLTPPNRLITPHFLRHQPVLTGPFAVPDIEVLDQLTEAKQKTKMTVKEKGHN
jgi:hypothetical protein